MKRLFCSIMASASLVALSGCDIFEPYEQPAEPPAPLDWNTTNDQNKSGWPDENWWEAFQAKELTDWMQEALHANDDLAVAVAHVREADANATIAGAPLLPALDATGDASRNVALDKRSPVNPAHGKSYSAALNASYELDFWGKNRSAYESSEYLAEASEFDEQTVRLSVTSSVAATYFDWLACNQRIKIAQDNLQASQKILDALHMRYNAGTISKLDLEQQENLVANVRAAIPPLQLKATQDLDALAILLGRLPESMPTPTVDFATLQVPQVPGGMPSELLERRPDVASAEASLKSAHANVNNARAQFFPSISLTAGPNLTSTSLSQLFSPHSALFSYGANVTQPIFEGGLLSGQLEYSHAYEDELTASYHKAIVNAFSDTENALAGYLRTKEQDDAQAEAEAHARAAFELSQKQFDAGTIDITVLLNTQQSLFTAADAHVQTRVNYLTAAVNLYVALGGGWKVADAK